MNTETSNTGFMPRSIAVTLLTSPQSKTNGFRKRCFRAMERVCEPKSRSTALPVSAPKTGEQRLQARLSKATAAQLTKWHARTLRRGNNLQDSLVETEEKYSPSDADDDSATYRVIELLKAQISAHDALCEAIQNELTLRSARGIGYRKPVKFRKA